MRYEQNNQLYPQRRRHDWISFLFPLGFLLIFVFTQSIAGLLTSVAIILLLWAIIGVDLSSQRRQYTAVIPPPIQHPATSSYGPDAEGSYEQGYMGTRQILQDDGVRGATGPKETAGTESESEYQGQMQVPYPEG